MIKRIQEIKSVGSFQNMTASHLQFEPITIIYGENTYGKSTLCDVLRSLSDNNPNYIVDRKSIPNPDRIGQSVKINLESENLNGETLCHFKNDEWAKKLPEDLKLLVFDGNFIYRNVFTGLTFERDNYENVTQFVLGEDSVQKAEQIAKNKSKLRKLKKELKDLKSNSFEGINDIKKFIELDIEHDLDNLDEQLQKLSSKIYSLQDIKNNFTDIKSREEPEYLNLDADLSLYLENLNSVLNGSLEQIHDEVKDKVVSHIQNETQNLDTTQSWIYKGLSHIKNEKCPFCGQDLEDVIELINLYKKFFDTSYEKYKEEVQQKLNRAENEISKFKLEKIRPNLSKNKAISIQYDKIEDDDFKENLRKLEKKSETLIKSLTEWEEIYPRLFNNVKDKIQKKRNAIDQELEKPSPSESLELFEKIENKIAQYELILKDIKNKIKSFKSSLDIDEIGNKVEHCKSKLEKLELLRRRVNSKKACKKYVDLVDKIKQTEIAIDKLEEELKDEQNSFLNEYFESINKIFRKLGSTKFSIQQKVSGRGYLPTIQISANYAGHDIKKAKLEAFFSESDKRALALAIFWAKIESLSEDQKEKTIVVLDDPVTSFDDGRIEQSIRLIDPKKYDLRQLVIISHYPRYLKLFFDRTYKDGSIKLLQLEKDETGSKLVEANSADFVETPHQKMLRRIIGYTERKHKGHIQGDLRVYLVNELKLRYRKQILNLSLEDAKFSELIDGLNENNIIRDETAYKLHDFRKSTNPSHHVIRDRPNEDILLLANDLLEFIYTKL
jgi:wobble nucleotide-excising tRNase